MTLAALVELISAMAIFGGLIFAALEVRHFRESREREAAMQLFETFQREEFVKGLRLIYELPHEKLDADQLTKALGDDMDSVFYVMSAFEGLGVLVQRREVEITLVEDFCSGAILEVWKRIKPYALRARKTSERDTFNEYFQWLAERIIERESKEPVVPAFVEFADWEA